MRMRLMLSATAALMGARRERPQPRRQVLLPSTVANAGKTGGSLSLKVPGVTVNGTVGSTVLTVEQMPAHTHTGSSSTAGAHTHTRGTMEITGAIPVDDHKIRYVEGAFIKTGTIPTATTATQKTALLARPLRLRERGPGKRRLAARTRTR